jgi:DNA-binding beta-propeller fold protein YncE
MQLPLGLAYGSASDWLRRVPRDLRNRGPDGVFAYVANNASGTLSVIHTRPTQSETIGLSYRSGAEAMASKRTGTPRTC